MSQQPRILYEYPSKPVEWNERDVLLFANTVGCTSEELWYLYELHPGFCVFPTYPIVLTFKHDYMSTANFKKHFTRHLTPPEGFVKGFPRLDVERVVDGERRLDIFRPLPTTSKGRDFRIRSLLVGVWDKGKGKATIVKTQHLLVEVGKSGTGVGGKREEMVYARMQETAIWLGSGGWGGGNSPTPRSTWTLPTHPPTATHTHSIPPTAHLLYRLNGDYNPLHATSVPNSVVQPTPIMHGLYSWNVAAHAVLQRFGGSDPRALKSFRAKFARPVRPGDELRVEMWTGERDGEVRFVGKVGGDVALSEGVAVLESKSQQSSRL